MKHLVITCILFLCCAAAKAQVAVGYFPFNYSMVQLTSSPEKLIFGDARMQTNSFISNSNIELAPFINLKRSEMVNYYFGVGVSINPFNHNDGVSLTNGYFITIGVRIKPLNINRNAALLFEISPYSNKDGNSAIIRTNLGLSYSFKKRKGK